MSERQLSFLSWVCLLHYSVFTLQVHNYIRIYKNSKMGNHIFEPIRWLLAGGFWDFRVTDLCAWKDFKAWHYHIPKRWLLQVEQGASESDNHEVRHKNLRVVYEQYWGHARHVANERLWFTNIYAIIVGGAFAFMVTSQSNIVHIYLPAFLLILSLLGFFMCHSLVMHFIWYSRMTELILINEWNLPYRRFFSEEGWPMEAIKFGLNKAFYFLYILMSSILAGLLVYNLASTCAFHISITTAIATFVVLFLLYQLGFKRSENRLKSTLEERVVSVVKSRSWRLDSIIAIYGDSFYWVGYWHLGCSVVLTWLALQLWLALLFQL